ncbi:MULTISPECIES: hypothetical protein [unclassified Streptomyces]|uniref:hypothetical protein n=1 Tax=unclassified Streptomyces TaxID=2593676 RepID=UPI00278C6B66|nr:MULTISPECIES: hypothetical protein [unclassified Streptomyces]
MCDHCDDFNRTVLMIGDLVLYAEYPGADRDFADVVGGGLALSLPVDGVPPDSGGTERPGSEG